MGTITMKEARENYQREYELEIDSCDRWIKWCEHQDPTDTHGMNFHQGKRSALVFHHIKTHWFFDKLEAVNKSCKETEQASKEHETLLRTLGALQISVNEIKEKENKMLVQIAALQVMLTTAAAAITSDLDTLETQITTLQNSGSLGPDDRTALDAMGSTVSALQSKADALVTPPAPVTAPAKVLTTESVNTGGAVGEGQSQ